MSIVAKDILKQQKKKLLGGKKEELMARSKYNPYLNEVIAEYDNLELEQKSKKPELSEALNLIKSHIDFLKKTYANEPDLLVKLENDLNNVQHQIDK